MTHSRTARRTALVAALLLVALVAAPAVPAGAATWNGRYSLWRANAFAPQYLDASCVGATVQIMLNLIRGESSHGKARQVQYLEYAQKNSKYPVEDGGADPEGWARAMVHFGGGDGYGWSNSSSIQGALHTAAKQMRQTGKPVGLLVHFGRHAWVMTGFESTADPNVTNDYTVTAAEVVGPLWPSGTLNGEKFDPGPKTWLDIRTLSRKFDTYAEPHQPAWAGRYVTILPRAAQAAQGQTSPDDPSPAAPDLNSAFGWIWVFSRLAERLAVRDLLWLH